jgi:hypothetical protein
MLCRGSLGMTPANGTKRKTRMAEEVKDEPRFTIPLPGGKVAKLPATVLAEYTQPDARAAHARPVKKAGKKVTAGGVTINIFAGEGSAEAAPVRVDVHHGEGDNDVVAHSLAVDPSTGVSDWHTDWEYGECEYTDEAGFPQRISAWHRHPFGTEYAELYEG